MNGVKTGFRKRLSKILSLALAVALLGLPGSVFAQQATGPRVGPAGAYYYNWQAVDESGVPYTGQDVNCTVTNPGYHGYVTLHSNSSLDDKTGGGLIWSDDNGKFHFYTSLAGPFDVQCYYKAGGGFTGRLRHTDHKIVVPRQGRQIARFSISTSSATFQSDSGIIIPEGSVIEDIVIQNMNPRALGTYHVNVGFLGNHADSTSHALAVNVPLTSGVTWVRPHTVKNAGNEGLNIHRGTALAYYHSSASGTYFERRYMVNQAGGLQVSYSVNPGVIGAAGANFAVLHVYILYQRLHSVSNSIPFGLGR